MSAGDDEMTSLDHLKELAMRAYDKMERLQEADPCCVPAEFETLILELIDSFAIYDEIYNQRRKTDHNI
jgi:hypothetical protein